MKKIFHFALLFVCIGGSAQTTVNNYKYVMVPAKFEFLKEADQYSLNSITKSVLERKGFTVYFDNEGLPAAIAGDPCQALRTEVTLRKGLLATNLTLLLKDCQGNIVFNSKEGKSREKDWATAYQGALLEASSSLDTLQYAYNGVPPTRLQSTPAAGAAVSPATTAPAAVPAATASAAGTLYAQATANGYQLIDTTPKIIYSLFKTSVPDTFLAEKGSVHGIVFKRDGDWVFEYYQDGKLLAEQVTIKF